LTGLCDRELRTLYPDSFKQAADLASPRVLKTHMSFDMLPKVENQKNQCLIISSHVVQDIMKKGKAKVIYVIRNPRDTCMSFYHHWRILEGYSGDVSSFVDAFLADVAGYYTPAIGHMLSFWNQRNRPNVLVIMYEDMKKDLAGVLRRVAAFVGKNIPEEKMPDLLHHLSFDQMKKNDAVNKNEYVEVSCFELLINVVFLPCLQAANKRFGADSEMSAFMRQGKAGTWREEFTPEMLLRFQEWEEKWLQGSDLTFKYD